MLAGDEDSMTNSREEELIDPPDVVFIGGLGEKFEEAVCMHFEYVLYTIFWKPSL